MRSMSKPENSWVFVSRNSNGANVGSVPTRNVSRAMALPAKAAMARAEAAAAKTFLNIMVRRSFEILSVRFADPERLLQGASSVGCNIAEVFGPLRDESPKFVRRSDRIGPIPQYSRAFVSKPPNCRQKAGAEEASRASQSFHAFTSHPFSRAASSSVGSGLTATQSPEASASGRSLRLSV